MYLLLLLFIVLTIPTLIIHFPWYDEAYAYILAQQMDFNNYLIILKHEGHFIIWYLLLLPFAKLNFCYPYPMFIINWLAYFIAIIVMWKKAPFNNILKIIITFSWCSLYYFPIVARCYSIGILGLFILAAMYNNQLKKPILYSIMIVLTAHTSLLATFPTIYLVIIFIYNLYKNRQTLSIKNIIFPILILVLGIYLWFLPFFDGYGVDGSVKIFTDTKLFVHFINIISCFYLYRICCYLILFILVLIFTDNKIRFVSVLTIISFILFFSLIYKISAHHCIFLTIYLILFIWLTPKLHNINLKTIILLILFSLLVFGTHTNLYYTINKRNNKDSIYNYINKGNNNSYMILSSWSYFELVAYLGYYNNCFVYDNKTSYSNEFVGYANEVAKNFIKYSNFERAYVISNLKINNNSKKFCAYYTKRNKPCIFYITNFEKPNSLTET